MPDGLAPRLERKPLSIWLEFGSAIDDLIKSIYQIVDVALVAWRRFHRVHLASGRKSPLSVLYRFENLTEELQI